MYNGSKSNLDLVLSFLPIADKINIQMWDETFGSDHFPLTIEVDAIKTRYHKQTFKLKSVRTIWNKFQNLLESDYGQFLTDDYDRMSPADKYQFFISIITKSIKIATPRKTNKKIKQIRNPVAWWDTECDEAKCARRASFKKWQSTLNMEDLIEYKKNCAKAKKLFKEKKPNISKILRAQSISEPAKHTYGINARY